MKKISHINGHEYSEQVIKRGYTLEHIAYSQGNDEEVNNLILEFMKGCKILEVRRNTTKGVTRKADMTDMMLDYPSFMIEREGNHYVVATIPDMQIWELFKVNYINN